MVVDLFVVLCLVRLIFWTNYASPRYIERADLDGSNVVSVIPDSLLEPTSLTLDVATRSFYWLDRDVSTQTYYIKTARYDGSRSYVLVQHLDAAHALMVHGVALYWLTSGSAGGSEQQQQLVQSVDKTNGVNKRTVRSSSSAHPLTDMISVQVRELAKNN